jgi:Tfp pilus assembly protein PilF
MADDPYDLDDKMQLSADPDNAADFNDVLPPKRRSKRPLAFLLLLVILIGGAGGLYAWQMFMTDSSLPAPAVTGSMNTANTIGLNTSANNNLPPQVSAATPPSAVPAPIDATKPVDPNAPPSDPNAVNASALPAPIDPNAPAAPAPISAVAPSAVPAPVTEAVAKNPNDPVPAAAAKIIANDIKPTDALKTDKAAPLAAVPAPSVKADATKDTSVPVKDIAPVVPAPSAQQLTPVDANNEITKAEDEAAHPASNIKAVKNDVEKKTADTIAAVNDILGGALPSSGNKTIDDTIAKASGKKPKVSNVPPPPTEVISRAQAMIKVKRSYSAESSQAINAAGNRVLQSDQYDAALEIYNKELRNNPSDIDALSGKAFALQKTGHDMEAMDTYQRLVDLNPRDIEALTNYLGLLQKQKPDEAMARLNKLSEQYPSNAAVAGQIGTIFASQMDTPNALRYFMKARALDATNPIYPFNIAVLYDRLGTADKADEYYRSALNTAEDNPDNVQGLSLDGIRSRMRDLNQ